MAILSISFNAMASEYQVTLTPRVSAGGSYTSNINFSDSDEDNFRKNNITARVEAQVGLAIERTDALRLGDFTNT